MDQNQMNHLGGAVAGMMGFFALFGLALVIFFIFLYWRILTKAGLPGALSLLTLIPGIGWIIVLCIRRVPQAAFEPTSRQRHAENIATGAEVLLGRVERTLC